MALPARARFWMVCRMPTGPGSKTEPRQRYDSHAEAHEAAEKLARENDADFLVLAPVSVARPGDARQETLL